MKTIEATYRIVTPMFIGGADGSPSDGVRPPSFKGALRFWWRALNWGRFYEDTQNEDNALKALHREEARLFGSAAQGDEGGQGVFLLSIKQPKSYIEDNAWPRVQPMGKSGFMGMGLWESGKKEKGNFQPHRVSISSNEPIKVRLGFRSNTQGADIEQIKQALKVMGLFGGLGSRSRRGFGSIALVELDDVNYTCPSISAYESFIKEALMDSCQQMFPSFTAMSDCTRVGYIAGQQNTAILAHQAASELFYKVRGMKAEVRGVNKRGFGQPLPLKPNKKEYEQRRASPLIFHIHPIGSQFICSHIFMPAQFLPHEGYDMRFYKGVETYMQKIKEVRA